MLVLSRKTGERLVIGDNITITVTKCSGNRVVIGIDAPKEISVRRAELAETREARSTSSDRALLRALSVA
jgi:carbon storage regulator